MMNTENAKREEETGVCERKKNEARSMSAQERNEEVEAGGGE